MTDSNVAIVQSILNDVDHVLRERLKGVGLELHHVILAVTPDGAGIVRSNVGPEALTDMAYLLAGIADQAVTSRPDNEPLN